MVAATLVVCATTFTDAVFSGNVTVWLSVTFVPLTLKTLKDVSEDVSALAGEICAGIIAKVAIAKTVRNARIREFNALNVRPSPVVVKKL